MKKISIIVTSLILICLCAVSCFAANNSRYATIKSDNNGVKYINSDTITNGTDDFGSYIECHTKMVFSPIYKQAHPEVKKALYSIAVERYYENKTIKIVSLALYDVRSRLISKATYSDDTLPVEIEEKSYNDVAWTRLYY